VSLVETRAHNHYSTCARWLVNSLHTDSLEERINEPCILLNSNVSSRGFFGSLERDMPLLVAAAGFANSLILRGVCASQIILLLDYLPNVLFAVRFDFVVNVLLEGSGPAPKIRPAQYLNI
jgi:hypothetical protein